MISWTTQPTTIIFVTHDLNEAIYLSDRVVFLSKAPAKVIKEIKINFARPRGFKSNKITTINEYYYDVDLELSYINIFSSENSIRDRVYSIELNSLRVDVWTMTGGGFTTREMFPIGLCEFVEINNVLTYIESRK